MPDSYPLSPSELEVIEIIAEINREEAAYFQAVYDELLATETIA
jgi:hypothetical protein